MKPKQTFELIFAVVILAVSGYMVYTLAVPHQSGASQGAQYVVVKPLTSEFNQEAISSLTDGTRAKDFYIAPDLKNGVGNNNPFSPLR